MIVVSMIRIRMLLKKAKRNERNIIFLMIGKQ